MSARATLTVLGPDDPPGLVAVARFADRLSGLPWFAAVGEPLSDAERADGDSYVAGLGYERGEVAAVVDWAEARALTRDPAWDRGWWDKEEALRRALLDELAAELPEARVMAALTRVTERAGAVVMGAASVAAARAGLADPYLARVAAGAATQASYQAALALLAGCGADHAFAAKHRLFAAGRWPVGLVGGALRVF